MLARAQSRFANQPHVTFVEGDASRLSDYFDFKFDAVIYSASIFLTPTTKTAWNKQRNCSRKRDHRFNFHGRVYNDTERICWKWPQGRQTRRSVIRNPLSLTNLRIFLRKFFHAAEHGPKTLALPCHVIKDFFQYRLCLQVCFRVLIIRLGWKRWKEFSHQKRSPEALFSGS